mmetsp:Transcript_3563/g.6753  ORF Transcript_3563/g.6753 Transcript_3563/m.6753 type:complete len:638 (+) Transcript_3563:2598-4511(+)
MKEFESMTGIEMPGLAFAALRGLNVTVNNVGRHGQFRRKMNGLSMTLTRPSKPGRLSVEFAALRRKLPEASENTNKKDLVPANYAWSHGRINRTARSIAAYAFLIRVLSWNYLIGRSWTYWRWEMTPDAVAGRRRHLAAWAREQMLRLGPCHIKLGQLSSSRSDLLPKEVVEELSFLQDRVPPFDFRLVRRIVESELGGRIEDTFSYFDPTPIAAASLGQVHFAVLRTGQECVLKVQRPGLKDIFDIDMKSLRVIASVLQERGWYGRDWLAIYEECRTILYQEIDYVREARSAEQFAANLAIFPWVRVPKIFWQHTTSKVLCMQYIPGIKISEIARLEAAGMNLTRISQRSAESYLKQILDKGLFHADPHPGNIAIGPGETLIYYDFGMMGQIQPMTRKRLIELLGGVVRKDADAVMNMLFELGALERVSDPSPIRRAIQYFLDNLQSRPMREQTVTAIGDDLYDIAYGKPFRFPAVFTFVLRAFGTLEGINKELDPDFKFSDVAKPFADELLGKGPNTSNALDYVFGARGESLRANIQRQAQEQLPAALAAPRTIANMNKTMEKLERGDFKVRARAIETEKLLRKQQNLTESSNFASAAGILAGRPPTYSSSLYQHLTTPVSKCALLSCLPLVTSS